MSDAQSVVSPEMVVNTQTSASPWPLGLGRKYSSWTGISGARTGGGGALPLYRVSSCSETAASPTGLSIEQNSVGRVECFVRVGRTRDAVRQVSVTASVGVTLLPLDAYSGDAGCMAGPRRLLSH